MAIALDAAVAEYRSVAFAESTKPILLKIRSLLQLSKPKDILFWAACLVSFFGLLRKANSAPTSVKSFDRSKHFIVGDIFKCAQGLALTVKHTKTIQCKERSFQVPLPFLHNHPLCPTTAVINLLRVHGQIQTTTPLFSLGSLRSVLTHKAFISQLNSVLQLCGLDHTNFSGHSFRRGGASWAFEAGLPGEIIQSLGDWRSQAYLVYLQIDLPIKFQWLQRFSYNLPC